MSSFRESSNVGVGMYQNRANPVMVQGEVSVTCFVDPIVLADRKFNVNNNVDGIYPGGNDDYNFRVNRGEIIMGRKHQEDYSGLPYVYGTSSANGEKYDQFGAHDQLENAHYFVGIAKTDYKTGDPDQPQHGFPVYVAGKTTVATNNDGEDKYAGDDLEVGFPPNPTTPGYDKSRIPNIVPGNRMGTPLGKQLYQFRRVDPTDYKMYWAGFVSRLIFSRHDSKGQGNQGITIDDLTNKFNPKNSHLKLTNIQEADAKLRMGLGTMILRALEYMLENDAMSELILNNNATSREKVVSLARTLELYEDRSVPSTELQNLFGHILFAELPFMTLKNEAKTKFDQDSNRNMTDPELKSVHEKYKTAVMHCGSFIGQGINLVGDRKRSKCVARVLASTPAYESMDVLLQKI